MDHRLSLERALSWANRAEEIASKVSNLEPEPEDYAHLQVAVAMANMWSRISNITYDQQDAIGIGSLRDELPTQDDYPTDVLIDIRHPRGA